MAKIKIKIKGDLDIFVAQNEEVIDDEIQKWDEVLIHGNPEGLKSFAKLLIQLAEYNQESDETLPIGARIHEHLRPKLELANSSDTVIIGRLDGKGNGAYYKRFIPKSKN